MSPNKYPERGTGKKAFTRFWCTYMYSARADAENQGLALYDAARNSVAHLFIPKGDIAVTFGSRERHLTRDRSDKVAIDADSLSDDFLKAYQDGFRKDLEFPGNGALRSQVEARVGELSSTLAAWSVPDVFPRVDLDALPRSGAGAYGYSGSSAATGPTGATGPSGPPGASGPASVPYL